MVSGEPITTKTEAEKTKTTLISLKHPTLGGKRTSY